MKRMMTAIDTNIVVRLIARDDPSQYAQAKDLVGSTICFVPDTVLLEVAWVLKSSYGASHAQIHAELTAVLGLSTIRVADFERIQKALQWYADGLDFADALHLATCQHLSDLRTFDQQFIKRAAGKGTCVVEQPRHF